ncbi:14941_t:CDS:2, partial [Dentiscutata erythropus]
IFQSFLRPFSELFSLQTIGCLLKTVMAVFTNMHVSWFDRFVLGVLRKYFFSINEPPQVITTGNIVFFSGKYVIENSDQCLTVGYASISTSVTRVSKKVESFIHFGVECLEYNLVTNTANIKMQVTVLYHSQSKRFEKYLGPFGSYIKLDNTYLISGLIKFSKSGKIIVEATEIDHLTTLNNTMLESSSSTLSGTRLIINIIADDIESRNQEPMTSVKYNISATFEDLEVSNNTKSSPSQNKKKKQSNYEDKEIINLDEDESTENKYEEREENHQPKRKKKIIEANNKGKKR